MKPVEDTAGEIDYLGPQLRELPYFRALLRAIEARFYHGLELPAPTLDVGCGDGHFASVAFERSLAVGVDPWLSPLQEAQQRKAYRSLVQADAGWLPFPGAHFSSAVSNSVLEHVPHISVVLSELARVLRPGAPFYFCVPNHRFLPNLSIARALDRMGAGRLAASYRRFFNRISRHHHCDPPELWEDRLEMAGFHLERWWHYFSPQALHTLEWGHYFGAPSLISRWLTGRWVLLQTGWNLALTERLVRPLYNEPWIAQNGTYTFFIARRKSEIV